MFQVIETDDRVPLSPCFPAVLLMVMVSLTSGITQRFVFWHVPNAGLKLLKFDDLVRECPSCNAHVLLMVLLSQTSGII